MGKEGNGGRDPNLRRARWQIGYALLPVLEVNFSSPNCKRIFSDLVMPLAVHPASKNVYQINRGK